jgi:cell pole-organizing protein PopZ
VAAAAVIFVSSAVAVGYYHGTWRHAPGFSAAYDALPNSRAVAVLAAEHQEIIDLTVASQTMSTPQSPKMVSPAKVVATAKAKAAAKVKAAQEAQQAAAAAAAAQAAQSSSTSTSTSSTTSTSTASGELSPSAAQTVAQQLMPSYGFSVSSQWTCLLDLWNNESGWEWDAENTSSGAYGIPQALPASKMASAGSDYMTDATTQIKWGLSYIQSTYSTPCGAWDFEEANGYY